jgi:hypothetical protein
MILRLHAAPPSGVHIEFNDKTVSVPPGVPLDRKAICRPNLATYPPPNPPSPMQGRTKRGSALEALMAFADKRGFREVL